MLEFEALFSWTKTPIARQSFASFSCYLGALTGPISYFWLVPYTTFLTIDVDTKIMTTIEFSTLIAMTSLGTSISAVPSALLADRYGRKFMILTTGPLSILLWLIVYLCKNIVVLYMVRLVQGLIFGIVETIVPVYIAEISSPEIRGTLSGLFTAFWNIGLLFCCVQAEYLSFNNYILTLIPIPLLFTFSFILMPESPYYYYMRNDKEKAELSLSWLRYGQDTVEERSAIEEAVMKDMENSGSWYDLIARKSDRRVLFIVLVVGTCRYMVGSSSLTVFQESIFDKLIQNILTSNQQLMCILFIFIAATLFSSFLSDKLGRRFLLLLSLLGCLISNVMIALYFYMLDLTTLDVKPYVAVAYIGIVGVSIFSSVGVVQLLPTIRAECFPSHTRSKGSSITNIFISLVLFLEFSTFTVITDYIGMYFNFLMFAVFCAIGWFCVDRYIPESARKTLAEVNNKIKTITGE